MTSSWVRWVLVYIYTTHLIHPSLPLSLSSSYFSGSLFCPSTHTHNRERERETVVERLSSRSSLRPLDLHQKRRKEVKRGGIDLISSIYL